MAGDGWKGRSLDILDQTFEILLFQLPNAPRAQAHGAKVVSRHHTGRKGQVRRDLIPQLCLALSVSKFALSAAAFKSRQSALKGTPFWTAMCFLRCREWLAVPTDMIFSFASFGLQTNFSCWLTMSLWHRLVR